MAHLKTILVLNISKQSLSTAKINTDYPQKSVLKTQNQRTNGPVNAHLISWPSKAQNIQNLENIW